MHMSNRSIPVIVPHDSPLTDAEHLARTPLATYVIRDPKELRGQAFTCVVIDEIVDKTGKPWRK